MESESLLTVPYPFVCDPTEFSKNRSVPGEFFKKPTGLTAIANQHPGYGASFFRSATPFADWHSRIFVRKYRSEEPTRTARKFLLSFRHPNHARSP